VALVGLIVRGSARMLLSETTAEVGTTFRTRSQLDNASYATGHWLGFGIQRREAVAIVGSHWVR
jgi:hypothetical protein